MTARRASSLDGIFHRGDHYLRFFRDGGFLDVLIRGAAPTSAAELRTWLVPGAGVREGRYTLEGSRLAFTTTSPLASPSRPVAYRGLVRGDQLVLDSLDHNTGRRETALVYERVR